MNQKESLLLFDNCMIGICNIGCSYCREKSFKFVEKSKVKSHGNTIDLDRLSEKLETAIKHSQHYFDIPIMKLSGYGEFLLLPDAIDILKRISKNYERVQVMTNGLILNEKIISELASIRGINICVSVDGHTTEMNKARNLSESSVKRIFRNISLLEKHGIPVEINSVLTKDNISVFGSFLSFLSDNYDSVTCYPFPVRGIQNKDIWVYGEEYAKELKSLLELGDEEKNVLPHIEYLRKLISFLKNKKRIDKCYVGYVNLGLEPSGTIPVCACSISKSVGNVSLQGARAFKKRKDSEVFASFLSPKIEFNECYRCFTHYEIINLYLDGTISLGDISRISLFSGPNTKRILIRLKNKIKF